MTPDFDPPGHRTAGHHGRGRPDAHVAPGAASFVDYLLRSGPPPAAPVPDTAAAAPGGVPLVHGTTIIAMSTAGGVLMAGDRRATAGNVIASSDIVKVHPADSYSAIGIAGVAGLGLELIKLFQVELEHYEKIEGTSLSLEGKASRLASMIRGNLGLTMQGLATVPLFAGYDVAAGIGRIYSFDVTGGRYTESEHHGIGSGSWFARGSLKKLWRRGLTEADAVAVAVEALYDAAEDDSATGGPDAIRRIWPVVAVVDAQGYRETSDDVLSAVVEDLLRRRSAAVTPPTPAAPPPPAPPPGGPPPAVPPPPPAPADVPPAASPESGTS